MKSFSQRMGFKPVRDKIQVDSMDDGLRNGLWNILMVSYWNTLTNGSSSRITPSYTKYSYPYIDFDSLFTRLWHNYFKFPLDTLDDYWPMTLKFIRKYFFECEWFEALDFIEFILQDGSVKEKSEKSIKAFNILLESELSAYRFIDGKISPITSEEEIAEIERALRIPISPVKEHLNTALELFSDRKNPDYRNSIKESISAVESLCKIITEDENATLSKALKKLECDDKMEMHKALKDGFNKLYGYTSDKGGIRHGLTEESNLDSEDARFMLISCSAFINYLVSKATKAGINIKRLY